MKELLAAVCKQMSITKKEFKKGYAADICHGGASAGFPGFCYYSDTNAFYQVNESHIWEKLNQDADDQGVSVLALIASFGGANQVHNEATFQNLLAWYALEETARFVLE